MSASDDVRVGGCGREAQSPVLLGPGLMAPLSVPLLPQSNKVPVVQHPHHVHPLTPLITYSNEHFTPGNPPPHLPADVDPKTGRPCAQEGVLVPGPPQDLLGGEKGGDWRGCGGASFPLLGVEKEDGEPEPAGDCSLFGKSLQRSGYPGRGHLGNLAASYLVFFQRSLQLLEPQADLEAVIVLEAPHGFLLRSLGALVHSSPKPWSPGG